ncbi:MAG: Ppx/GppA family phosphatase [Coriobacteriia bacterium]|nr:Ppx/GppA family phosphatase [Coriobacteriia bacterium]
MRVAAIDVGTVTTRLLVADVTEGPDGVSLVREVLRDLEITHLGEGLEATGRLSDAGMRRVAAAVRRFAGGARVAGAERVAAVATSACRDAANTAELLEMLAEAGAQAEVVSGEREARLSFLGAAYSLTGDGLLVADLGGGSTELILGHAHVRGVPEVEAARSYDVGSRRMTERVLVTHPPAPEALERAREWALAEMRPFFDETPGTPRVLVSLAGTATTLSAIHHGMTVYDPERVHGSVLTSEDLDALLERLAPLTLEELREVPGLHPGRASVIVAGAVVLSAVLELSGLPSTVVSEHDILYGIALDAYSARERP